MTDEGRPGGVVDQRPQVQVLNWQNPFFLPAALVLLLLVLLVISVEKSDRGVSIPFVPEGRTEWVTESSVKKEKS